MDVPVLTASAWCFCDFVGGRFRVLVSLLVRWRVCDVLDSCSGSARLDVFYRHQLTEVSPSLTRIHDIQDSLLSACAGELYSRIESRPFLARDSCRLLTSW